MKKTKHLFIFEGEVKEPKIFEKFESILHSNTQREYEIVTLNTNITLLYNKLIEYFDDLPTAKVRSELTTDFFLEFDEELNIDVPFTETYLIFDYEPHEKDVTEEMIDYIADIFNEETEYGMLLLNFPMVESLYDIFHSELNCQKSLFNYMQNDKFSYKPIVNKYAESKKIYRLPNTKDNKKSIINNKVKLSLLDITKYDAVITSMVLLYNIVKVMKILNINKDNMYFSIPDITKKMIDKHKDINKSNDFFIVSTLFVIYYLNSNFIDILLDNIQKSCDNTILDKLELLKMYIN